MFASRFLNSFIKIQKMKLDRKEILTALETISVAGEGKNMVESGAVQNVMTFGDEVVVDVTLHTPALHIKKRAEVDIMKVIHEKIYDKAKVKVLGKKYNGRLICKSF